MSGNGHASQCGKDVLANKPGDFRILAFCVNHRCISFQEVVDTFTSSVSVFRKKLGMELMGYEKLAV